MTVRNYIDILEGTFVLRCLLPWQENLKKRQVKSPKLYLKDSGLFHWLMSIENFEQLTGHPKLGASWEGFALEHVIHIFRTRDAYFWATHAGAELDLMVTIAGKRHGFEFKYTDAPGGKRSMHTAIEDLGLEHLWVIYPGDQKYALNNKITVIQLDLISQLVGTGLDVQKNSAT